MYLPKRNKNLLPRLKTGLKGNVRRGHSARSAAKAWIYKEMRVRDPQIVLMSLWKWLQTNLYKILTLQCFVPFFINILRKNINISQIMIYIGIFLVILDIGETFLIKSVWEVKIQF